MSKYLCICGHTFRRKHEADLHLENIERLEIASADNIRSFHKIIKRHWRAGLVDFIFSLPIHRTFKLCGGMMIYFVITHHFKINLSIWESCLIGAGMGLLIE